MSGRAAALPPPPQRNIPPLPLWRTMNLWVGGSTGRPKGDLACSRPPCQLSAATTARRLCCEHWRCCSSRCARWRRANLRACWRAGSLGAGRAVIGGCWTGRCDRSSGMRHGLGPGGCSPLPARGGSPEEGGAVHTRSPCSQVVQQLRVVAGREDGVAACGRRRGRLRAMRRMSSAPHMRRWSALTMARLGQRRGAERGL